MRLRGVGVVALFLAALFAGDRVLAWVAGKVLDLSADPIAMLYSGAGKAEIIALGNSRIYYTMDLADLRDQFGGEVLNLAVPGAPTTFSAALLADYLDRYGPPRVVVFEVSGLQTPPRAVIQTRPFVGRSQRIADLLHENEPYFYYGGLVSHLLNFNGNAVLNIAHKIFFPVPDLRLDGTIAAHDVEAAFRSGADAYFAVQPENVAAFREIVALSDRYGFDLRLMIAPTVPAYARVNRLEDTAALTREVAGRRKVWDYSVEPLTDPALFRDFVHLNRAGVAAFMSVLRADGFFAPGATAR